MNVRILTAVVVGATLFVTGCSSDLAGVALNNGNDFYDEGPTGRCGGCLQRGNRP
jgi:hypothetical protein